MSKISEYPGHINEDAEFVPTKETRKQREERWRNEHQWDGPIVPLEYANVVSCSKCGADASYIGPCEAKPMTADNIEYRVTVTGNCGKFHASVEEWRRCPACSAKTMTMVERVAEAIALAGNGGTWDDWYNEDQKEFHRRRARAAMSAMREPTSEMVEEGLNKPKGMMDWRAAVACSWRVMVDEALKE